MAASRPPRAEDRRRRGHRDVGHPGGDPGGAHPVATGTPGQSRTGRPTGEARRTASCTGCCRAQTAGGRGADRGAGHRRPDRWERCRRPAAPVRRDARGRGPRGQRCADRAGGPTELLGMTPARTPPVRTAPMGSTPAGRTAAQPRSPRPAAAGPPARLVPAAHLVPAARLAPAARPDRDDRQRRDDPGLAGGQAGARGRGVAGPDGRRCQAPVDRRDARPRRTRPRWGRLPSACGRRGLRR